MIVAVYGNLAWQAENEALMEEMCVSCIVGWKMMQQVVLLQRLCLPEWLAMAAVQRYGSNTAKVSEAHFYI